MQDETLTDAEITETPGWLERLHEKSWEVEILISSGVIFSLFQLGELILKEKIFLSETYPFHHLNEITIILMLVIKALTIGFTLQLFLRGLWVAFLCLNSVFPKGLIARKFNFSGLYRSQLKDFTLTNQIESLGRLSSLIFYGSFIFIFVATGFYFVFILFSLLAFNSILGTIVLIFYFIFLMDFIFAGPLRKNKIIGMIYYPIYIFFNYLTLAFIYRKSFQILFSNINKSKASIFVLLFFSLTVPFTYFSLYKVFHWRGLLESIAPKREYPSAQNETIEVADNFYLDKIKEDEEIWGFSIESQYMEHSFMNVFVPYRFYYEESVRKTKTNSFARILKIKLNGKEIDNLEWFNYRRKGGLQWGVMTMLPLTDALHGKNLISVFVNNENAVTDSTSVPFWKE